jgi:hypothetical protein
MVGGGGGGVGGGYGYIASNNISFGGISAGSSGGGMSGMMKDYVPSLSLGETPCRNMNMNSNVFFSNSPQQFCSLERIGNIMKTFVPFNNLALSPVRLSALNNSVQPAPVVLKGNLVVKDDNNNNNNNNNNQNFSSEYSKINSE